MYKYIYTPETLHISIEFIFYIKNNVIDVVYSISSINPVIYVIDPELVIYQAPYNELTIKQKEVLIIALNKLNESINTVSTGGKKIKYILNGDKVSLLHNNKRLQRSIYVKENGKAKYCKINKEYILLSKLKKSKHNKV